MTPSSEIQSVCEKWRKAQKKIVFTNGCFDILHRGHVTYLTQARALGDVLLVGLNSDAGVRKLKGATRPIQCEEDRAAILSALKAVDFVAVFDDETPLALIQLVRPDFLVKGGDWSISQIVGADFVQSYGGKVLSLPFVEGRSTSDLVTKIRGL